MTFFLVGVGRGGGIGFSESEERECSNWYMR